MTPPLGWITPKDRTPLQWQSNDLCLSLMPQHFAIRGSAPDVGPYVNLMELWKHADVQSALGYEYSGTHQLSGSCVGAGGGNALFTLVAIEVLRLNDPEQIILPFWLYPYGKSRELLGEQSEGEGSLGSTFAEACKRFGVFGNHEDGLPSPQNSDGLVWGKDVEMRWSNGKAAAPKWVDLGKRFLVKTTTALKSSADARLAIRNGYPVTFACNNYMTPGQERVQGSGAEAACVGSLSSRGGHQTSLLATWDHPKLGLLFWNQNQWGNSVYKADPKTGRRDGCWMTAKDFDNAIRSLDAEVFAFSQYDGYPAQEFTWGDALRNF